MPDKLHPLAGNPAAARPLAAENPGQGPQAR